MPCTTLDDDEAEFNGSWPPAATSSSSSSQQQPPIGVSYRHDNGKGAAG